MSDLGEWDEAPAEAAAAEPHKSAEDGLADAMAAAVDSAALSSGIDAAVQRALTKRLDAIATQTISEVLDEEQVEALAAAAQESVQRSITSDEPHLYFSSLPEFVDTFLLDTYRRAVGSAARTWCPQWWRHAEALVRLEALWRSWEHLRLDPATGTSVWLRDHADHHMAVLLDPDGPFKGCTPESHAKRPLPPLPGDPPPPALFQTDPPAD